MASTVVITGASQGIGKAIAQKFAGEGYNVVLSARQSDRLEAVTQDLKTSGYEALAISTDVKDPEQVKNLIQRAIAHYGAIDVLINNAGIYLSGPVEEFSLDDWHQAIDTNLWGYVHTIHAILPHLLERGKGTIVNLGSIGGKVPVPYLVPYTTTKFAVTGLTQALQAELSVKGIQVCGIYPNLIKTDFLERAIFRGKDAEDERDRRRQVEQLLEVPFVEKPEDVVKAVWEAVTQNRDEVVVGSAKISLASHNFLPGIVQWMMRKAFRNKDQDQPIAS
ncbi:SDR family oxidoreductase [Oscillatoria sp. FACHB-1407]|uniref:SDR family NAD(P)-dependent oxidoreductase n=1 Tax=Oscillatoria sp. FACHB-1407 TaxID=2692847 RepID=UPI00168989C2|nr:SDR family oxidoreductase [Oscillatoria sp. FACHB-1407]MBD2463879.1 SDR family oxidoreductase [Oscillatoria sp. FACHB-1407]